MNRMLIGFALLAGTAFASGQEPPRVEAKEPTVVTVHGSSRRIEPMQAKQQKKRRFRFGGLKALAGAANAGGWLLNAGDDIPSSRERQLQTR